MKTRTALLHGLDRFAQQLSKTTGVMWVASILSIIVLLAMDSRPVAHFAEHVIRYQEQQRLSSDVRQICATAGSAAYGYALNRIYGVPLEVLKRSASKPLEVWLASWAPSTPGTRKALVTYDATQNAMGLVYMHPEWGTWGSMNEVEALCNSQHDYLLAQLLP